MNLLGILLDGGRLLTVDGEIEPWRSKVSDLPKVTQLGRVRTEIPISSILFPENRRVRGNFKNHLHFIDEESEAQRGAVVCLRHTAREVQGHELRLC